MNNLKETRKIRKLTLERVAQKVGLSPNAISQYETSKREASYDTLKKLSQIYNVSIDYLLGNNTNSVATTVMPLEQAREIFLNSLSIDQQEVISKVLTLTAYQLVRVQCYMTGLIEK